jgi:hypothetical protein
MPGFDPTSASRAVLIEVLNVLGVFRDKIVLVGGWVPDLLYPNSGHIGSLDVDLAVSQDAIGASAYESIRMRMIEAGYEHHAYPARFTKLVAGVKEPIKVDLVGGQYGAGKKTQAIQVNELGLNTLRGLDLAFDVCQDIEIPGTMPDGTQNIVRARIVRPEGYILIKAFALEERMKEKDAYDVHFTLVHYRPTIESLAERVRVLLSNGLAREGYEILKRKFGELNAVGPTWAARLAQEQGGDFEQSQRSAFEYAQALFRGVAEGGQQVV